MSLRKALGLWCVLLVATLAATGAALHWLDQPLARIFMANASGLSVLGRGFSSSILVAGEMGVAICLAAIRMINGRLPEAGKALLLACCASLCAFAVNDHVLKVIFGRPNPAMYLFASVSPGFHLFQGSQQSSFPSGHMAMASAFAAAIVRIYPRTLTIFMTLLALGAALLIVGDWHFLSDVLTGAFVGGTAGFVAGELWMEHTQRRNDLR